MRRRSAYKILRYYIMYSLYIHNNLYYNEKRFYDKFKKFILLPRKKLAKRFFLCYHIQVEKRKSALCVFYFANKTLASRYYQNNLIWGYGSVGRAPRSQRGGHEFESRYLHHMQIIRTLKTNRSSYYFLQRTSSA